MAETPNLGLPYLAEGQAQPHIPHNQALDLIDAAIASGGGGSGGSAEVVNPLGGFIRLEVYTVELTLSGANVTASGLIPAPWYARPILLGVTSWVVDAITGATSWSVGYSAEGSEFGGSLGVGAGQSNAGVVGPTGLYSDTDIVVSSSGGNFTGGTVRLAAHCLVCGVNQ